MPNGPLPNVALPSASDTTVGHGTLLVNNSPIWYWFQKFGSEPDVPLGSGTTQDVVPGDAIRAGSGGDGAVTFESEGIKIHVWGDSGARLCREGMAPPDAPLRKRLRLDSGLVNVKVETDRKLSVDILTDWATITSTGTQFAVYEAPGTSTTTVTVAEGTVRVEGGGESVAVPQGMVTSITRGHFPDPPRQATPDDTASLKALTNGALSDTDIVGPIAQTPTPGTDKTPTVTAQPVPQQLRSDFPYGILVGERSNAPLANAAHFRVMAATLSWSNTEPNRGQFRFEEHDKFGQIAANDLTNLVDAATKNNLKLAVRLIDPPAWAGGSPSHVQPGDLREYVAHLVTYAGPALAYFELFNELNLGFEWGGAPDPAAYARLTAAAHEGIRSADPSARIPLVSAGPAQRTGGHGDPMEDVDWLAVFLDAGGKTSVDAIGTRAYLGNFDPEADPSSCVPLCFREIEQFRMLAQQHGATQDFYITEFGALETTPNDLGDFNWMKLAPDQRAANLVKALHMANANYPWVRGATVFNLDAATLQGASASTAPYWFGLLNSDRSTRLAYDRIRQAREAGQL